MDLKERTTVAVTASQHVIFASASETAPRLEGLLSPRSPVAAVLCHQQPATSTMDDPLLLALEARLADADISVLRFNFRSVAASEGEPTDGRLEPLDVAGAGPLFGSAPPPPPPPGGPVRPGLCARA